MIKAKGRVVPNMWHQSGPLPGAVEVGAVVAYHQGKQKTVRSRMGRMGFEPTEKQIANAKRADKGLRKFSWETE